jgi:uncharacterized protein
MYGGGVGVPRDAAEALKWLRKAAEQGDAYGQLCLGSVLRGIGGVAKDDVEAAKWARKAADQGNVPAQLMLSDMYDKGLGVPQDYVLAYMWFNLGAANTDFGGAEINHRYGLRPWEAITRRGIPRQTDRQDDPPTRRRRRSGWRGNGSR